MSNQIDLGRVLFLDAECVSSTHHLEHLSEELQQLWRSKAMSLQKIPKTEEYTIDQAAEYYQERAAIYSEFGKIVCISVGIVHRAKKDQTLQLRVNSYYGDDEKELLEGFAQLLNQYYNDPKNSYLCGHNIKEFDIPYICRRMVINQVPLPTLLQINGKKPWETDYLIDTLTLWKFGDYKKYTSLKLLTGIFGIPSPKDDIDGSEVGRVYWEEEDGQRIARYCEKDVIATAQVYLRMHYLPLLEDENIRSVSDWNTTEPSETENAPENETPSEAETTD